ncbi:hypothetical protein STEG23_024654 [Scotinomys teguina]
MGRTRVSSRATPRVHVLQGTKSFISNQKTFGYPLNYCSTIASVDTSFQKNQCCSIQRSTLDKTIDDFSPPIPFVEPSGNMKTKQPGGFPGIQRTSTFHIIGKILNKLDQLILMKLDISLNLKLTDLAGDRQARQGFYSALKSSCLLPYLAFM